MKTTDRVIASTHVSPPATTHPRWFARFATTLTSTRGARAALLIAAIAFLATFGLLSGVTAPQGNQPAPSDSESARATSALATFPGADRQSLLIVITRTDGGRLSAADRAASEAMLPAAAHITGLAASGPQFSDDGAAAIVSAPMTTSDDSSVNAALISKLRADVHSALPAGLQAQVTGGPAFGADIAAAFDGANITLLLVTIGIVALLLIATYRSPILWLVPLVVVGLADQLASVVTAGAGAAFGLQFEAGIVSVLVFGAGTNYALLLISRYREELARTTGHRRALAVAWRATIPAIVASNVTVVLSLLSLALAVIPGTRGLGIAAAIGLLIAVAAVTLVLPPALAVCGRRVFWPLTPKPGAARGQGQFWQRIARVVMRRPAVSLIAGLMVLGVMALGLIGTSVGLDQAQKFRVPSESATGLETVAAHFAPGATQPILIVARSGEAAAVTAAAAQVEGVAQAHPVSTTADHELTAIMVTGAYVPGTQQSMELIQRLRTAVHSVSGADAVVGGATATEFDARAGNEHDLGVIAPVVLAVSFLILLILLRSLIAPALLLLINLASATAAIGLGAWLSRELFAAPALDAQVPLLAFLFLVALGIDYTIFLVHRARTEAAAHGTRAGMAAALAHTGSVITSAGIVLAAVFAALGVLPLVVLGQLGLIVGVGVVVDTVVVRSVIVPALFGVLGDRIWLPGRPHRVKAESADDDNRIAIPA